jgi:hypothetical protein
MTTQRTRSGISWKTFWSVLAPMLAGVFAAAALLVDMPAWAAVTLLAVAAVAVGAVGRLVATRSPMFAGLDESAQRTVSVWVSIAVACYAVWAAVTILRPDLTWWWTSGPVVLGGLTYLTSRGHEYLLTKLRPAPRPVRSALALTAGPDAAGGLAAPPLPPRGEDEPVLAWRFRQALTLSGLGWLTVIGHTPVIDAADGATVGYKFRLRRPVRIHVPSGKGVRELVTPKPPEDMADRIALTLSSVANTPFAPEWVQIVPAADRAGDLEVLVLTEDVMAKVRMYRTPARPAWTTVLEPTPLAWDMEGSPFAWDWCHHGRLIGGTQWGKSSAIQRMMLALATARDAIYWAASVEKFYDLIGPVLTGYQGIGYRPPVDWLAWTPQAMLHMLITAMHIVRWRQRQPHSARRFKKIFIFLDEVSFAARIRGVRGEYQGQRVDISRMLAMLAQAGESAGVYLVLASQRGVQGHLGDHGGDITPNMGWSVALRTSDSLDTGRVTGLYRLPRLSLPGQAYVESPGRPTTCVRFEYPQTSDPSKPVYDTTAPTVDEAFWALREFQTHRGGDGAEVTSDRELDTGSVGAAGEYGPHYANRPRYVTEELMSALMGAYTDPTGSHTDPDTTTPAGSSAPGGDMRDALATVLRLRGVKVPAEFTATRSPATSVAVLSAHRSIRQRILNCVRAAGGQAQRGDIIAALRRDDAGLSEQTVQNELSDMVNNTGEMCRPVDQDGKPVRGLYAIAN